MQIYSGTIYNRPRTQMHHLTYCSKCIIWCMSRWHVFSLEVLLTSVLEDPGVSIMPHAQHELIAEIPMGVNGTSITEGVQECQSDTDSKRQWLLFVLPYSYTWLTICSDLMLTDLSLPGESLWPLWLTSLKVLFMMVCPQYWVCGLTHHGLPTVLGLWSHTPWFAHSIGSVVSHTMVCPQYWVCGLVTHTMVCPQYWVCGLVTHTMVCPQYWFCGLTDHGLPTVLGLWSHTPWFAHSIGSVVWWHTPWFAHSIGSVVSHTMVCPQYWVCGLTHHGLPTILGLWSHTPWFAHNIGSVVWWHTPWFAHNIGCGHTPWFAHSIGSVVSHTSFPLAALLSPIIHT